MRRSINGRLPGEGGGAAGEASGGDKVTVLYSWISRDTMLKSASRGTFFLSCGNINVILHSINKNCSKFFW